MVPEQTTPPQEHVEKRRSLCIHKDPSQASLSGGEFEFKLAGLLNARLRAERRRRPDMEIRFLIATNVLGANPFDDLIVHLQWKDDDAKDRGVTYFVQMKHSDGNNKYVNTHELTAKKVSKRTRDFNLRKYFKFYQKLVQNSKECASDVDHNQGILREWARGECRFVLFTTRAVRRGRRDEGADSDKVNEGDTSDEGDGEVERLSRFPFHRLFDTGQGEAFSFGPGDTRVWDMVEGPERDSFRTRFLPHLLVCARQAHARDLDDPLHSALADALGSAPPRPEPFLAQYLALLRSWWDSKSGDCISEHSTAIEEVLQHAVNDSVEFQPLEFHPKYYSDLRLLLKDDPVTYVIVPEISTRLRSSKLRRVLDKACPGRYLVLTEAALRAYPAGALEAACRARCDELVLNVDALDGPLRALVARLLADGACRVRVLQAALDGAVRNFLAAHVPELQVLLDRYWTLEQLASGEQLRLLARRVRVQGRAAALGQLESAWPSLRRGVGGATLEALACGDAVALGGALPRPASLYLPRTLQHRAVLHEGLWSLRSAADHFLLSGFPDAVLRRLRPPAAAWEERDPLDAGRAGGERAAVRTSWSAWDGGPREQLCCLDQSKSFHWLSYEHGEIVWNETQGDSEVVSKYLKNFSPKCDASPTCSHHDVEDFIGWEGVFFLSGDAGMGKTTFMLQTAHALKAHDASHWVVVLRLNEGKTMEDLSRVDAEAIVDLLDRAANARASLASEAAKNFLRDSLLHSGSVTVLVDGVDDVCPAYKDTALAVLRTLVQRTRCRRVWVACRPVLEEDLSRALGCRPFALRPFSPGDQQRYLLAFWGDGEEECGAEEFRSTVEQLVDTVRSATQHDGRSLCDLPLYAHMLAVAYKHDRSRLQEAVRRSKGPKYNSINLLTLIRKFVEETRGVYWDRAGLPTGAVTNHRWASKHDAEFQKEHQNCAVFLTLYDRDLFGDIMDSVRDNVHELALDLEREKTGIITNFVNGKPRFIHKVFAEYFAAQWLVQQFPSLPQGALAALYEGARFEYVRVFFDALLADGSALHEAALGGCAADVLAALRDGSQGPDARDAGGRSALHLAATRGRADAVTALLSAGANASLPDAVLCWTPLRYADTALRLPPLPDDAEHLRVMELLLRSGAQPADAPRVLKHKRTLLLPALKHDHAQIARLLVKRRGPLLLQRRRRPEHVHVAARHGSERAIRALLALGFAAGTRERGSGHTPLHEAAAHGQAAACALLLQRGARVGARCARGRTPLHEAAARGYAAACAALLAAGADPHASDVEGRTPRQEALAWGVDSPVGRVLAAAPARASAPSLADRTRAALRALLGAVRRQ